jgi:hypothetical protein
MTSYPVVEQLDQRRADPGIQMGARVVVLLADVQPTRYHVCLAEAPAEQAVVDPGSVRPAGINSLYPAEASVDTFTLRRAYYVRVIRGSYECRTYLDWVGECLADFVSGRRAVRLAKIARMGMRKVGELFGVAVPDADTHRLAAENARRCCVSRANHGTYAAAKRIPKCNR